MPAVLDFFPLTRGVPGVDLFVGTKPENIDSRSTIGSLATSELFRNGRLVFLAPRVGAEGRYVQMNERLEHLVHDGFFLSQADFLVAHETQAKLVVALTGLRGGFSFSESLFRIILGLRTTDLGLGSALQEVLTAIRIRSE